MKPKLKRFFEGLAVFLKYLLILFFVFVATLVACLIAVAFLLPALVWWLFRKIFPKKKAQGNKNQELFPHVPEYVDPNEL